MVEEGTRSLYKPTTMHDRSLQRCFTYMSHDLHDLYAYDSQPNLELDVFREIYIFIVFTYRAVGFDFHIDITVLLQWLRLKPVYNVQNLKLQIASNKIHSRLSWLSLKWSLWFHPMTNVHSRVQGQ